jgi:hypothetical protein
MRHDCRFLDESFINEVLEMHLLTIVEKKSRQWYYCSQNLFIK